MRLAAASECIVRIKQSQHAISALFCSVHDVPELQFLDWLQLTMNSLFRKTLILPSSFEGRTIKRVRIFM